MPDESSFDVGIALRSHCDYDPVHAPFVGCGFQRRLDAIPLLSKRRQLAESIRISCNHSDRKLRQSVSKRWCRGWYWRSPPLTRLQFRKQDREALPILSEMGKSHPLIRNAHEPTPRSCCRSTGLQQALDVTCSNLALDPGKIRA